MAFNKQLFFRKTHRYVGLFIGIQFLGWTVSGLFFSWNNIDNVHGDHIRKSPHFIATTSPLVSPDKAITELKNKQQIDSIHSVHLISLVGKPLYQVIYFAGHTEGVHHHTYYALADASTGNLRGPLTKEESIALAKDNVVASAEVVNAELLTNTNGHHEYREAPLPAYAITLKIPIALSTSVQRKERSKLSGMTNGEHLISCGCFIRWTMLVAMTSITGYCASFQFSDCLPYSPALFYTSFHLVH